MTDCLSGKISNLRNNESYLFQIVLVIPTVLMVAMVVQTQFVFVVKISRPRMKTIWTAASKRKVLILVSALLIAMTINLVNNRVSIRSKINIISVRAR